MSDGMESAKSNVGRPFPRLGRGFVRLGRDRKGTAAMEFAFIAAPLAALMVAILQTSLVFFAQQTLETAAEKSVRQLVTGQAQRDGLSAAQFKTLVCSKLPSFMKCANVMVDVRTATNFSSASTAPTLTFDGTGNVSNSWQYAPGGSGAINVATIMYIWSTQTGPLNFDLSTMSSNRRLLYATAVFRTEPYS